LDRRGWSGIDPDMALSDFWSTSRDQLEGKRVQQIIAFAGGGQLSDGGPAASEFGEFLSVVPSSLLARYADECLWDSFAGSGFALQDIVNHALAKDPAERYANAHDLLSDLRAVQAGVTLSKLLPKPLLRQPSSKKRLILALAAVIVMVAAVYGVYRWKHRPLAFQERGWVLISDFDSSGEDPIPDKGVREGLTIALQQSPYVNVFPRTRAYEALQRMKRIDVSRIDETLGRDICRRENLQVLLAGSIEHLGQSFQITVRAVDPVTGNLVLAEKESFTHKEQFFDKVDKLARAVRKDLGESITGIAKSSRPLAKVTTSSLEALQLYSEASDFMAQGKLDPVQALLQGALQLDPDFAMAHVQLAHVYGILGNRARELEHLQRAYELRDGLTDREERLIEATYYDEQGQFEKEVESLKVFVSLYPDDPQAHHELAAAYRDVGDLSNAIEQMRQVVRLNPSSARGYVDLVRFLARSNQNNEAIAAYQEALRHGGDTPNLHWGLGLALLGSDKVAEARQEFSRVQSAGGAYQSIGRIYLARTDMYQGKFSSATAQLRSGILADQASRNTSPELLEHYLLATMYFNSGRGDLARREINPMLALDKTKVTQAADLLRVGTLYARMGDVASANTARERLEALSSASTTFAKACVHVIAGEIAMAQGKLSSAEPFLVMANQEYPMALSHESLARLYQAQRDWPKAVAEWQKVLDSRGEILQDHSPLDWVMAHLEIARAYSRLNDASSAEAHYKEFLQLWKEADALPVRDQALREWQALTTRLQGRGRPEAVRSVSR